MKVLIFLPTLLIIQEAFSRENCEEGAYVRDVYHEKEVLKSGLDRPYSLAVAYVTNTLYFSYSSDSEEDSFKTARLSLNSKKFQDIAGVNNGFAQTVDPRTNDVYIGGRDGIFKYDYNTDTAEFYGASGANIWSIFFKDQLYYSTFPSQFLYTLSNGESVRCKEFQDTKVDLFLIDRDDFMFYTNATGLYGQQKGTNNTVTYKEFDSKGVRGMTIDSIGDVYVCFSDGIYLAKKDEVELEKVVDIENSYGVAFDNSNNLVYSDLTQLVRLKPNKDKSCS